MTAYDEVRYPSRTYAQTHPNRLAAVARLNGLPAVAPASCRVLEVGCGDGANLIGMAEGLPGAQFVGVDLAASAIQEAQETARALDIGNVEFREVDLSDWRDQGWGEFDYVVAHGVFSWVPDSVRGALLEMCGNLLSPHGLAYISYNAYPGFHLREAARRMMRFHVRDRSDPKDRILQARSLLKLLSSHPGDPPDAYSSMVREAFEHSLEYHSSAFYHDDLSEVNQAFYLHEFLDRAASHGLQFLAEAELRAMEYGRPGTEAQQILDAMAAQDICVKEQYLDFLSGRRFRQTLLCRDSLVLDRFRGADALRSLVVAAEWRREPTDGSSVKFTGKKKAEVEATDPAVIAAMDRVVDAWPLGLCVPEVSGGDPRIEELILKAARAGALELWAETAPLVLRPSVHPTAGRLARRQLGNSDIVTTLQHTRIKLEDPAARILLPLLDGTRDRHRIVQDFAVRCEAEGLEVEAAPGGGQSMRTHAAASIEKWLGDLARLGLLAA